MDEILKALPLRVWRACIEALKLRLGWVRQKLPPHGHVLKLAIVDIPCKRVERQLFDYSESSLHLVFQVFVREVEFPFSQFFHQD